MKDYLALNHVLVSTQLWLELCEAMQMLKSGYGSSSWWDAEDFCTFQAKSVLFYIAIRSAVCYAPFPPTSISFFTRGSLHSVLLVTHFAPSPWFSLLRTDDCNFILRILCKTFLDFVLSITTLIAQYVYNIPTVLMFLNIGLHLMESLNKKMDMWQCKSCVHVSLF